ncbi:MAG: 50S ribosomal protein L29 [Neomegalonema sp.]|nr:50S ribosomal protein L29 [Neomegalonema sp.]
MKIEELRQMTPDQLKDELLNYKKEQFNLRFQAASGEVQNTARMRDLRRAAARVKTLLNEKAIAAAKGAAEAAEPAGE